MYYAWSFFPRQTHTWTKTATYLPHSTLSSSVVVFWPKIHESFIRFFVPVFLSFCFKKKQELFLSRQTSYFNIIFVFSSLVRICTYRNKFSDHHHHTAIHSHMDPEKSKLAHFIPVIGFWNLRILVQCVTFSSSWDIFFVGRWKTLGIHRDFFFFFYIFYFFFSRSRTTTGKYGTVGGGCFCHFNMSACCRTRAYESTFSPRFSKKFSLFFCYIRCVYYTLLFIFLFLLSPLALS